MLGTRPDLSYAIGAVSQFFSTLSVNHLAALHHIHRCIRRSAHLQLHLTRCSAFGVIPKTSFLTSTQPPNPKITWDTAITCHSDGHWADCLNSRHSTGAYIHWADQSPVPCSSKIKATVALSCTEAEYTAHTQPTKVEICLRFLLSETLDRQYKKLPSIALFAHNQGCIALEHNPEYHARTQHNDIQHDFVM